MKWALTLLGILTLPLLFNSQALEVLRLKTFDAVVETPNATGHFTVLNITEQDLDNLGGYPLPRQDLAKIHKDIMDAGAYGVGWVMLFPHADRMGGDDAFALELSKSPSVIAMPEVDNGLYPATHGTVIKGPDITLPQSFRFLIECRYTKTISESRCYLCTSRCDNLVRTYHLLQQTTNNKWVASFGPTEVLKRYLGVVILIRLYKSEWY